MITVKLPEYTVGDNAIREIGRIAKAYGDKVLVIGGKNALEITGDEIEKSLKSKDISILDFMWYGGECSYKNIDIISQEAKAKGTELIIGVGGGKALDTAKAVAEKINLPIITIPTIAATCAATTPLSVIYTDKGDYDSIYLLKTPPVHILISTNIIAKAPTKYLWAGIGDTLSKYYEVEITSRGKELSHSVAMGKELSILCSEPLLKYGAKALASNEKGETSFELQEVILNNIITTGIVSMLVGEEYVSACAHALFYGLTLLEEIEKHHLHGEVVAYGVLVMLMMDGQEEELHKLLDFYKTTKLPTALKDINLKNDVELLNPVLEKAVDTEDTQRMPYEVTKEMFFEAIQKLEEMNQ
ncbi:iron-containing alcohol dehydrogenase family protein [Natronincola ferrireducens]|uniref:Glycerol dehydrogenase n=1 Tax=Natronincola ferrireducens TaxID=393762 RepID=A0A1G9FWY4_9FIRM|nr:iron-containing alcohol dehydrogenase family protein [Natronincola ferrireducens]SDK92889.1 glycerol dehydrogenase [Natronincola ferrireducens]